jgi:putative SOS response-associated peptidase YedK
MCSNYRTVTHLDHLASFFGVHRKPDEVPPEFKAEVWPLGLAPFIRLDDLGRRRMEGGHFGLLPHFAKEIAYGRRTYNARSETVHQKPSFRDAWRRGQRCIIPAEAVYEPNYESGKPVRWCIEQAGGVPMGIAGIYTQHPTMVDGKGEPVLSFAMLTVNADGHPVFSRMHAPDDEKRMVVILEPGDYDAWLTCSTEEAVSYFRQFHGPLQASAKPLPPRRKKPPAGEAPAPLLD